MCVSRYFGAGGVDGTSVMVELDDDRDMVGGGYSGGYEVNIVVDVVDGEGAI